MAALAYMMSYWLLPPIWRYAQAAPAASRRPTSSPRKYDSPALGVLVALVGVVAMIPYLVLQFKGLGIIVVDGVVRRDLLDGGDLDRRRRASRSMSWCRACTARPGPRSLKDVLILAVVRVPRHLSADPLLRRLSARCSRDRRGEARLPRAAAEGR